MNENIRAPIYAGSFYPAQKAELSKTINSFLKKTKAKKISGTVKAIIVPHAGYVYSGGVAASAYKAITKSNPSKVILFGPSHQAYLEGAFSFSGTWQTPLSTTNLSSADLSIIKNDNEHSLEVQLPFLQTVLEKFDFTPIIYGEISPEELADIVSCEITNKSLLIASSDLSHYEDYKIAKQIDSETIKSILELDLEKFLKVGDACGKLGLAALIILAKKNNWKATLLQYKNSGDTAGDKKSVVGYASIVFVEKEKFK
ncbi:MAG: AmmeMemoRadiSam system protein B [archaeon]|jgi:hypothetical protein